VGKWKVGKGGGGEVVDVRDKEEKDQETKTGKPSRSDSNFRTQ